MKHYFVALLVLTGLNVVKAQWSKSTKIDPFEGKRTTVIGSGYSGDWPYNNPYIVFRKGSELEVYIGGAGSTACNQLSVSFSFGDPNNVLTFSGSESVNGDAMFLIFTTKSINVLIDRLKKGSIVYVEYSTRCSRNRFKINLNGSTSALNAIFNSDYYNELKIIEQNRIQKELEEKRKEEEFKTINKLEFIENKLRKIHKDSIGEFIITDSGVLDVMEGAKTTQRSYFSRAVDFRIEEDYYNNTSYKRIKLLEQNRNGDIDDDLFAHRVKIKYLNTEK